MRKDHSLYEIPVIAKGHPFEEKFKFRPELQKLVAFSLAMKLPRHRWFYYKPGFAPDIVKQLLLDYGSEGQNVFLDPFSGVGTGPMAVRLGYHATGLDISPLGLRLEGQKSQI